MSNQQWLSVEEVATILKVGEPTIQLLIEQGLLEAEQGSDGLRVSRAALVEYRKHEQQTLDEGQQPPEVAVLPPTDL